jgi:hypothetical protein
LSDLLRCCRGAAAGNLISTAVRLKLEWSQLMDRRSFLLAAIAAALCGCVPSTHGEYIHKDRAIREGLGNALELFRADVGRYPNTNEGFLALAQNPGDPKWNGPYVDQLRQEVLADYRYTLGADGKPHIEARHR